MRIIRVFPRRTEWTPRDQLAFVGDPPLPAFQPEADQVHVSVTFSWDKAEGSRLKESWSQFYQDVQLGGPVTGFYEPGEFVPGRYIKHGVTFTSRGCNNKCPWCLAWWREGLLWETRDFAPGWIVEDNNLLQCSRRHIEAVFGMLRRQPQRIILAGGLDARLMRPWIADRIKTLSLEELFFSADYPESLVPLEKAIQLLRPMTRRYIRCYVLLAHGGQTINQAQYMLESVYKLGAMPFAQLYQPEERYIDYPAPWRDLARKWSRPAITRSINK